MYFATYLYEMHANRDVQMTGYDNVAYIHLQNVHVLILVLGGTVHVHVHALQILSLETHPPTLAFVSKKCFKQTSWLPSLQSHA